MIRPNSNLWVHVLQHGAPVPGAMVRLDGMGVQRILPTNANGSVQFSNLNAGKYIVNAAKLSTVFGNGFYTLRPGETGTLFLRYPTPQKRESEEEPEKGSEKGSLEVFVLWKKTDGSSVVSDGSVTILGPEFRKSMIAWGGAKFRRIASGSYSVQVTATAPGGMVSFGRSTALVRPGATKAVHIFLVNSANCEDGVFTSLR